MPYLQSQPQARVVDRGTEVKIYNPSVNSFPFPAAVCHLDKYGILVEWYRLTDNKSEIMDRRWTAWYSSCVDRVPNVKV